MEQFTARHVAAIVGVLEGFDRLLLRGILPVISHAGGLYSFLHSKGIALKDFNRHLPVES